MGRLYCITGKSGSGKDTFYRALLRRYSRLTPVIPSTTRPIRENEVDGETYNFVTPESLALLEARGGIVEKREYHTVQGLWTYFTPRFEMEPGRDYVVITTLEGARSFIGAFGRENVALVYLSLDDGERLARCLTRERAQHRPDYAEMCRRYLADEADFSPQKLSELGDMYRIDTTGTVDDALAQWEQIFNSADNE